MKKGNKSEIANEKVNGRQTDSQKATKKNEKKHYIAEKKNVKAKKEKKDNVFKIITKYFNGVGKELKRIRWTDRKDLVKYTICTLGFVAFFGVYFYAIDWVVLLVRSLAN